MRLNFQVALCIDGRRRDAVPRLDVNGNTFTGQCTLIHRRMSLKNDAVNRNPAAGSNDHNITHQHLVGRNRLLRTVTQNRGRRRTKIHQGTNGVTGFALRPEFEKFTERNQGQNHSRRLKIEIFAVKGHGVPVPLSHRIGHQENRKDTVTQCRTGTDGNQRIHIGTAMPQCFQAAEIISTIQDDDRQRQK